MRILQAENIAPINVGPGDGIQLTYKQRFVRKGIFGREVELYEKDHVLMTETFDEPRTIDRVAIVELENGELEALGMSQGIAGVFGRQA